MKIKKFTESSNPLAYFSDKGYTNNIQGLDKLTEIVEDSLIPYDVTVERVINEDSKSDDPYNKITCSVSFNVKKIVSHNSSFSIGHPYSSVEIKLSKIKERQRLAVEEYQNFIKLVNSTVGRTEQSGYKLISYNIRDRQTYTDISISYLVEW